jgi:hypothetical protein
MVSGLAVDEEDSLMSNRFLSDAASDSRLMPGRCPADARG